MPSSREIFHDPWIKPMVLKSPALAGGFFTTSATWETLSIYLLYPFVSSYPQLWFSEIFIGW